MNKYFAILILYFFSYKLCYSQQTNIQYINDELNRVIQVTYPGGSIIQYKYDKLGNREEHKIIGQATPADLTIVNQLASPTTIGQGGTCTLTYLLQNAGTFAAGVSQTKFYLNSTITLAGATLLDSISHNGVPSGGINVTKSITMPTSTAIGSKYIILVADAKTQVTEGNENNNQASIAISVIPCNGISATLSTVTNTTCNQSNGSATVNANGGTSYAYLWNTIPQSTTSTANNLSAGSYTVTVTAENGCSATTMVNINNTGAVPQANYLYTTPSINTIQFTNTSSNNPTTYEWNFGNGISSTQSSPTYIYPLSGTYNVCLTSSNSCGIDTKCQNVQVNNGCDYPGEIQVNNIGLDSVTISWAYVPLSNSYNLRYKHVDSSIWVYINNINQQFVKLTGLSGTSAYVFQIQSNCALPSLWSGQYNFNTLSNYTGPLRSFHNKYNLGSRYGQFIERISNSTCVIGVSENVDLSWDTPAPSKPVIVKIDNEGNVIWSKECSRMGYLSGVSKLPNGTLVTGIYRTDYYHVICMDTLQGNILWQKTFNTDLSSGGQTGCSIESDGSNNVIISFMERIYGPEEYLTLIKMNSAGTVLWSKWFTQGNNNGPNQIRLKTDSSNNIFAYGSFGYGNTYASPILIKYDANGSLLWHRMDLEQGHNYVSDIEFDASSNIYFSANYLANGHHLFGKFGQNGNVLWTRANLGQSYGYDLLSRGISIVGNKFFISGYNKNDNKGFITQVDTSGLNETNFRYQKLTGETSFTEITNYRNDLINLADTTLFVTGRYHDPANNNSGNSTLGFSKLNLYRLSSCKHESFSPIIQPKEYTQHYTNVINFSSSAYTYEIDTSTVAFTNISVVKTNTCEAFCSLLASFITPKDTFCQSEPVQFTFTGYNASSYKWRIVGSSTILSSAKNPILTFNQTGSISIELEASNSTCAKYFQKTIYLNSKPVLLSTKVHPTCPSSSNGSITLIVSGGTTPFTYLWSNSSSTQNISGLTSGVYKATLTDANGCFATKSDTLSNINHNPNAQLLVTYDPVITTQPIASLYTYKSLVSSTNSTSCQLKVNNGNWIPLNSCNNAPGYVHTTTTHGDYTITLKATNICGIYETNQTLNIADCKYYQDLDGDGKGNPYMGIHNCAGESGFVQNTLDCNDNLSSVYLEAPELCDLIDNNCNNLIDEGCAYYFPPPPCVNWLSPVNAATNVPVNTILKWSSGLNAIRYKLFLGSTNGMNFDIYNGLELTDTSLTLPANLPYNSTFFAKIVPYSIGGNPLNCTTISFTTAAGTLPNPILLGIDTSSVSLKYSVFLKESTINNLKIFGSQTGLKLGVYSMNNDTVLFTSNNRFMPGEQITIISKKEIRTVANQDTRPFTFERTSITPTQGVVNFDSIGTGIILSSINNFENSGCRMVDLNADGHMDFIYVSYSENKIYLYIRNNVNGFQSQTLSSQASGPKLKSLTDFNNDGLLDIFITTGEGTSTRGYLFFNSLSGQFSSNNQVQFSLGFNLDYFSISDIDLDGDLDAIIPKISSNQNDVIRVFINNGLGDFTLNGQYNTPGTLNTIKTADIDNDGDQDIILTKKIYNQVFQVYNNIGLGTFSNSVTIPTLGDKYILDINYYNNDSNMDMILANPNTEAFLNNSGINYNLNSPSQISSNNLSVFRGDLDGDGDIDIMNGVSDWYANNGNGLFIKTPIPGIRTAMPSFELFDYEGDGDLDQLFINLATKEVKILRNLSEKALPEVQLIDNNKVILTYPKNLLATTVNASNIKIFGDETGYRAGSFSVNANEVLFTSSIPFRAGEKIHITSKSAIQYQVGGNAPSATFILDANITNLTTATFDTIGTGIIIPSNEISHLGANGIDANKDGGEDIVSHFKNESTGYMHYKIYKRNANGSFGAPITQAGNLTFVVLIGTADVNADGYIDLVFGDNSLGNPSKIEIRYGNSNASYSGSSQLNVPHILKGGKICDVDKDGDMDVIIYSSSNSTNAGYNMEISVLKNNGAGNFSVFANLSPGIYGNSIEVGDLDKDGDMDIFFTSSSTIGSLKKFRIYMNDGFGNFVLWIDEDNPATKTIAKVLDINDDNLLDVVTNSPRAELYYSNSQSPVSLTNPSDTIVNSSANVLYGDLDGDEDIDFFIPNTSIANSPLLKQINNGDGTFTEKVQNGYILPTVNALDMMDYDNDGDLDYLYINSTTRELMIALNNCNYVTRLTISDSPLNGLYKANQEIILLNSITIPNSTDVILMAPMVKSMGLLNAGALSNITIDPLGCN